MILVPYNMPMELFSLAGIDPHAIQICQILHNNGYQAFIVGGCVRDLLLNVIPKDWDITSDALPEQVMDLFPDNILTGLQHGTITVKMHSECNQETSLYEITTFRTEGKYLDGRRPSSVSFVANIEEDLARRDLTINAMAHDPINQRLVDPFGGQNDLNLGILRAVGNAIERFQEDGLRIMRVARFASRFGYAVDNATIDGMKTSIETLKQVSRERIRDELSKTLMSDHSSVGLLLLQECGALNIVCPTFENRLMPLLQHQNLCQGELETRLAFLFNRLPVDIARKELAGLRFAKSEIKKTCFLL